MNLNQQQLIAAKEAGFLVKGEIVYGVGGIGFADINNVLAKFAELLAKRNAISEDAVADFIQGADVSVDISTGDHDHDARIFGKVIECMTVKGGSANFTILVEPDEPFKPTLPAEQDSERPTDFSNISNVKLHGDFEVNITFKSCRSASLFKQLLDAAIANRKDGV